MESNFIRERAVVREQLIKKNLDQQQKTTKNLKNGLVGSFENPPERVVAIEELVNDGLRQDLVDVSKQVDTICETIADYAKVKAALKVLKPNPTNVRLLTNLGCNFYAQCHVENASQVYLCVGKEYFLSMELDEAITMIEFKEKQWMKVLDGLQEKASAIKAYIKIALEAIGKVYEVDRERLSASEVSLDT